MPIRCVLCEKEVSRTINGRIFYTYMKMRDRLRDYSSWNLFFHKTCLSKAHIYKREKAYNSEMCEVCNKKISTKAYHLYINDNMVSLHISCFKRFIINDKLKKLINMFTNGLS